MEIHYKIFFNGSQISLLDAINKELIVVTENGLAISKQLLVLESSELFDKVGKEIFDQDILIDDMGKRYLVKKLKGTYFIKEINGSRGGISAALSGLKLGNQLDNMKVELVSF